MEIIKRYRYIGKNGIITSSVELNGIEAIKMYKLIASPGKILTNGNITCSAIQIFAEELKEWSEIDEGNN